MLANPAMFGIEGDKPDDQAQCAWHQLDTIKKSEFALKHAIDDTDWSPPGYILDGLGWLARGDIADDGTMIDQAAPIFEAPDAAVAHDG